MNLRKHLTALLVVACSIAISPIIPLADAITADTKPRYPWSSRINRAKRFARHRNAKVGFAVIDEHGVIRGGKDIHGVYRSASVVKTVMMVCYLNHKSVRNRKLNKFDRNLLSPMIRRSANEPANWIYSHMGPGCLKNVARKLKMEKFATESTWGRTHITPLSAAVLFKNFDSVIVPRHRTYARNLLARVVPAQRWGLAPVKPGNWIIRFKGGWAAGGNGGRIVNQAARFERGDRRFMIAVLTDQNRTHSYGTSTISGVGARLLARYNDYSG